MANTSETLSEEILARVSALPPSDQAELVSILGVRAHEAGVWEEEHIQHSDLVRSAAETIREAQEHELAAGRRVNPYLMLREALEILRR